MIERIASAVGKVGFHGIIGLLTIGALVFALIYPLVIDAAEGSWQATISVRAFDVLAVAAGGLLAGAIAVFRSYGGGNGGGGTP